MGARFRNWNVHTGLQMFSYCDIPLHLFRRYAKLYLTLERSRLIYICSQTQSHVENTWSLWFLLHYSIFFMLTARNCCFPLVEQWGHHRRAHEAELSSCSLMVSASPVWKSFLFFLGYGVLMIWMIRRLKQVWWVFLWPIMSEAGLNCHKTTLSVIVIVSTIASWDRCYQ